MTDEDRARRRANKLANERLKLIAALCNTMAVATFITVVVAPFVNDRPLRPGQALLASLLLLVLHGAGQLCLRFWKSEE